MKNIKLFEDYDGDFDPIDDEDVNYGLDIEKDWLEYAKRNAPDVDKGSKWGQIEYHLSMAKDISISLIGESEKNRRNVKTLFLDMLAAATYDWDKN